MITKRIIPCLDVKDGRVVKGVNFAGLQDMADPVEMARYYNAAGADELVFYDITASVEGRGLFKDVLERVAGEVFIPLTVGGAIRTLDASGRVDVIIVARGGGSFEDLIGFSDERVVRAAYACTTPLISSIGHEDDWTLLDLVADLRASTPTDAAKRVVPDVREQSQLIEGAIDRMRLRVRSRVENEIRLIEGYANRPSLTQPHTMLEPHQRLIDDSLQRLDIGLRRIVDDAQLTVERAHASLTALSPQSTLNRGYAVVQSADGHVLDDASQVSPGDGITVTLKKGVITATTTSATA